MRSWNDLPISEQVVFLRRNKERFFTGSAFLLRSLEKFRAAIT